MKIVLLGLIVVALIDGIVAAPRDNDNHLVEKVDDSKSEFETILAQLQQLQAQLNDQQQRTKEQQHQMEEQQDQIKEQQHRMEVQQQRNEEQQRQMKAFMQINRARQSDAETAPVNPMSDVHEVGLVTRLIKAVKTNIRDLVVAKLAAAEMRMEKQIETIKDGIAQCAVGNYTTKLGASDQYKSHFDLVHTVRYGRTFSRVPTIMTSINGFERGKIFAGLAGHNGHGHEYNIQITVYNPTEDKFDLKLHVLNVQIKRLEVTWIACT